MKELVSWFSAGTASAVNTKLALAVYSATHKVTVARCIVPEEHPDNGRFAAECAGWFGRPILELRSTEYANCEDVWRRRKYMSGPKGAPCSIEMKKAVRWAYETAHHPDLQTFGYTFDEKDRVERLRADNPELKLVFPLIDNGLTKEDCHAIVERAGIVRPMMYRLGFANANCIGCVRGAGPGYWNRTRQHFPEVFERRRVLANELGVRLVKGTTGDRERYSLDDLDPSLGLDETDTSVECSLLCALAETRL